MQTEKQAKQLMALRRHWNAALQAFGELNHKERERIFYRLGLDNLWVYEPRTLQAAGVASKSNAESVRQAEEKFLKIMLSLLA